MAISPAFRAHALDLLSLAGTVTARAMFGGVGLYADGVMFGLLDDDQLFLKTDDASRAAFVAAGSRVWVYPSPKGPMATSYYSPPDDAYDDAERMLPWAQLAIAAAHRLHAAKTAAKRPKATATTAKTKAPPPKATTKPPEAQPSSRPRTRKPTA